MPELVNDWPVVNLSYTSVPELVNDWSVVNLFASAAAAAFAGGSVCRLLGVWVASLTLSTINELHTAPAPQGRHI